MNQETLGQFLKKEREFKGMSLEQLSELTRINSSVLKSIEEDRSHRVPQGIYVRGFLKSYALHVGLNPDDILSRHQGLQIKPLEEKDLSFPLQREKYPFDRRLSLFLTIGSGIIILGLAALISLR